MKVKRLYRFTKNYKKILEGVVNIINTTENSDIGFANIRTYLGENCPELKEPEDEKIRKELIEHINRFKTTTLSDFKEREYDSWIAWIEKQGDQKHKDRYTFNSIPRLLDMIEPTDRAKSYCQKLIDSLLQEGYTTDAKIVNNCLKRMNGEEVSMATMDEQKLADFDFENLKLGSNPSIINR